MCPQAGPKQHLSAWRAETNRRSSGSWRGVQGAIGLPAATPTIYASQNPRDPYDRRRCRSQPQEDRSPASNVHFGRGEVSALQVATPPHARPWDSFSCHSMHTARAHPRSTAPPSVGEGARTPTTRRPGAEPDPAPPCRAAVRPRRRTKMRGSPGVHLLSGPGRSARSSAARSSATAPQHDTRGEGRQAEAADHLSTETPTRGQVHGGDLYQALTALRRKPVMRCPLFSLSQSGSR